MATLKIELQPRADQTAFNLRRWSELQEDEQLGRELARFDWRIETNRYGHIIMFPPPGYSHGSYQFEIGRLLNVLLPEGRTATESPISTADGVKAADVTWISHELRTAIEGKYCLAKAPEICVEVLSPKNTRAEMAEKKALFFAAGAREVWFCDKKGAMTFFVGARSRGGKASKLCRKFPRTVRL